VFLKITKSRASCLLQALLIFASPIAPILADTQNQPEREVVVLAINDV
jgi:hypothetical protein